MACPICINNYNKSMCAEVKCASCDYGSCKSCVRTYLLTTVQDPHCMNCRVKWSMEFTKNAIGATFLNKEYREHKTKQLIDQVIARREEYLPEAIIFRDDREDKRAIAEITKQMQLYPRNHQRIQEFNDAIEDIQNKIENRHGRPPQFRNPLRAIIYMRAHRTNANPSSSKQFIMPCQNGECNGMLDEAYGCQICMNTTCSKCLEIVRPNHKCNPDAVASAKAINKESKPCPKCGCRISKIDGCDQMWCIICRTAFSWNTGEIEDGRVHNPHYYQFMREQQARREREELEEEVVIHRRCSVRQDALDWMFRRLRLNIKVEQDALVFMTDFIQFANHVSEVVIPQLEQKQAGIANIKTDIYLYLLGELGKTELGSKLYLNKRANDNNTAFIDIYNAVNIVADRICQDISTGQRNVQLLHSTVLKYSLYFNIELLKLVKLYNTKRVIEMVEMYERGKAVAYKQYDMKSLLERDLDSFTIWYSSQCTK